MDYTRGGVRILTDKVFFGMIRIGISEEQVINTKIPSVLIIDGELTFNKAAYFGKGTRIKIKKGAELVVGHNTMITGNTSVVCYQRIELGAECMLSWDILIMDSDTHPIVDKEGRVINQNKTVSIGDKVWIGCRSMVLKGSNIPANCVIAAGTVVTCQRKQTLQPSTIIAGNPPSSVKEIQEWSRYPIQ